MAQQCLAPVSLWKGPHPAPSPSELAVELSIPLVLPCRDWDVSFQMPFRQTVGGIRGMLLSKNECVMIYSKGEGCLRGKRLAFQGGMA